MWAMRWLVPVITALSVSGCDNFKDCGGFWDKTFGMESCDYKRELVQVPTDDATPRQTSIEAAFQDNVKAIPAGEQAQWTPLDKLPADELGNEFITAFQVTVDPHLTSGDIFIVNGIAYQATVIEAGEGSWIVHTEQPDITAVFKTLNMTGRMPLSGSDVSPVALQAGAASDPAGGTTFKFDRFGTDLTIPSSESGGCSTLKAVLGKHKIEAASLEKYGATINFACRGSDFKVNTAGGKSYSGGTYDNNHFTGTLDYKGELGFYGDITFNEYSPLSAEAAKNIAISGYSYLKADVTANMDYQLHQVRRVGSHKVNITVPVPTPIGPVPVVVSFYFFADMLLDAGLAADATLHLHHLGKVEWSAKDEEFTTSQVPLNDKTPLLTGSAEGTASVRMRPAVGVGIAGAIPAAMGIPVGGVAEFVAKGNVTATPDGISGEGCASLKISPMAGLDFILTPQQVKKNGLGYKYTKSLYTKVFSPVYERNDTGNGGECLLSPLPVATIIYGVRDGASMGTLYGMSSLVSSTHIKRSGVDYGLTAFMSRPSSGGEIISYHWELFHTQRADDLPLDSPERFMVFDGLQPWLPVGELRAGDYMTLTVKEKKTIKLSETQSKTVETERTISESLNVNTPPQVSAFLAFDTKSQNLVLSIKGSSDDVAIKKYKWCFDAQNDVVYCESSSRGASLEYGYLGSSGQILDVKTVPFKDITFAPTPPSTVRAQLKHPIKARVMVWDDEGDLSFLDVSEGVLFGEAGTLVMKSTDAIKGSVEIPLGDGVTSKDIYNNYKVYFDGKACDIIPQAWWPTDALFETKITAENCPLGNGGVYPIVVKKRDVQVWEGKVIVSPVSSHQPATAFKDEVTTFTLNGAGFTTNMAYTVTNCVDVVKLSQTATNIEFSCKPTVIGTEHIILKDKSGDTGTVLYDGAVEVSVPFRLNDTGITQCSSDNTIFAGCSAASLGGWYGLNQDGEVGRDFLAANDKLAKVGTGDAGFDFTKISAAGKPLLANANEWSCVKDNYTGLMWEVKTNDEGLRDKDNRYKWYNPDSGTNDTMVFVQDVNKVGLCGYSDWRLPSKQELGGIVNFGKYDPSIDSAYFPNTGNDWFWTSSPVASSDTAWIVYFSDGTTVNYSASTNQASVRLVRSSQ